MLLMCIVHLKPYSFILTAAFMYLQLSNFMHATACLYILCIAIYSYV